MKTRYLVLLVVILLALTACSEKTAETTEAAAEPTVAVETTVPERTEQTVLELFHKYADEPGRNVIDWVAVPDSACGVVGVVEYTDADYDGIRFVFLTMDGPLQGRTGTPDCMPMPGTLEYIGTDRISYQFQTEDGKTITNTIFVESDGNGYTNFEVASQ